MKYKAGDIIEKMDGDIAKVHLVWSDGTYYIGCQGEYWNNVKENQIKSLCARKPEEKLEIEILRFELMEFDDDV